jgi:uncharacterized membrane protein
VIEAPAPVDAAVERRWRRAVWGASAAFFVVFGALILRRHATFGTPVFDFGIFDQGLWLLSRFDEPFVTLRGLHLFGDHSSYLMLGLLPLYWVWDDPRALLLLTVAALAATAPIVYRVGRGEGLAPVLAAAIAAGYLLAPGTQWQAWDSFHPETLTIPLLVGAYALAQRERWWWTVAVLALALTAKEDVFLVVVPFGIYLWWRWRRPREGLAVVGLGLVAAALSFAVLLPHFSPTGELLYNNRYARFGEGPLGIAVGMFTNPTEVLDVLWAGDQLTYLLAMLVPLALCLLAPDVLAIAGPVTLANMLSAHTYQHQIRYHYTAYLLAVAAVAAAVGARRLVTRWPAVDVRAAAVGAVALAVAGSLAVGPWPLGQRDPWRGWASDPGAVRGALARIPGDAVVSADWYLGTHLAHRRTVYEFPGPFQRPLSAWAAPGVPLPEPATVEWVAVLRRIADDSDEVAAVLDRLRADPRFEVVIDDEHVALLRRRDA